MFMRISEFLKNVTYQSSNGAYFLFRYVKSRNDKQLRNKAAEQFTGECDPEATAGPAKAPIVPCGLIAWSLFNDTYKFSSDSNSIEVNKKHIAWESDRKHKFGSDIYPKNFQTQGLIGGAQLNSSIPVMFILI